jgi:uncharacterized membrane protein
MLESGVPTGGGSQSEARQSASPSSWAHRRPVVVLAVVGCALATYLTLYQWRLMGSVWDPFFGSASSEAVLSSAISHYLPLPDATLGAAAYLVEAVVTAVGGSDRWRATPWVVVVFGVVLAGLALTSLALVLIQLFVVHALCTLCLCSAAISWLNAWLGHDEVFASLADLRRAIACGAPLWAALCGRASIPPTPNSPGAPDDGQRALMTAALSMPRRLRIAQLAPPFESVPPAGYGGTERVIATLTDELVRRGHDVTLFASGDSQTSARLVPTVPRALWHGRPDYEDFAPFWAVILGQVWRQLEEFDVVHSHLDYFGFPMARARVRPILTTLHDRLDLPQLGQLYGEFTNVPLVSISDAQRRPVPEANWLATIYHGIDLDQHTFNPAAGESGLPRPDFAPQRRPYRYPRRPSRTDAAEDRRPTTASI